MRKRLIKAIKNQSITINKTNERINATEPLKIENDFISINQDSLDLWNGYGDKILEIDEKIDNNNTEINNKIDTNITNIENLNNQINTINTQQNINTNDILNLKANDTQQDNKIDTNTINITNLETKNQEQDTKIQQNKDSINNLIQQLKDSNIINYVGEYQAGNKYKLGQVLSFQNKLYLCKVESSTNEPTNTNDYDLLSAPEIDLSNYYNKTQIDQQQQEQDTQIETNKNNISNLNNEVQTNKQNITNINTKFNDYYTKQEFENYSIDLKPNQLKLSENTKIDNNNDNEIILSAPQNITNIATGDDGVEKFKTETRVDGFYINRFKAQPTKNTEILNNDTVITDLGGNKVMVIAQADIRNYLSSGQDLFNALPEVLRNLRNVNNIEYFEYNFIEIKDGKNKIFTNYIGNVAATVYSNRIYLRIENNLPSYVEYIRFKLIYNKI